FSVLNFVLGTFHLFPTLRSSDRENAMGLAGFFRDHARLEPVHVDPAQFAGLDVAHIGGPDQVEGAGFRSNHPGFADLAEAQGAEDRKSTRLNSSHVKISYAVFCL